jgi:hypothetical protein
MKYFLTGYSFTEKKDLYIFENCELLSSCFEMWEKGNSEDTEAKNIFLNA